jgi:hypothetical protein
MRPRVSTKADSCRRLYRLPHQVNGGSKLVGYRLHCLTRLRTDCRIDPPPSVMTDSCTTNPDSCRYPYARHERWGSNRHQFPISTSSRTLRLLQYCTSHREVNYLKISRQRLSRAQMTRLLGHVHFWSEAASKCFVIGPSICTV